MHMTSTAVKYSYTGHPRIASSSCIGPSPGILLSCMLNGGYYADSASIMGTMGLLTMHAPYIVLGITLCLG